jgi:protein involved in polysaccharide export with SLBB domain
MKMAVLVGALCVVMLSLAGAQPLTSLRMSGTAAADPATYLVSGEISLPGRYPYIDGMKVSDAIKRAGGMTSRGSAEAIFILRFVSGETREFKATLDTGVRPNDVIRVGVLRQG